MHVVQDFPDVFLEELPGMPPDREIEFFYRVITWHSPNIQETLSDEPLTIGRDQEVD